MDMDMLSELLQIQEMRLQSATANEALPLPFVSAH
jgi:hypothetical protein